MTAKKKNILIAGIFIVAVISIIGLGLYRQGENKRPTVSAPRVAYIRITEDGFTPQALKIKSGTEVIWTNSDTGVHYIISNSQAGLASLNSKSNLTTNGTYRYTFDRKGTFNYHDKLHPLDNGQIIVE